MPTPHNQRIIDRLLEMADGWRFHPPRYRLVCSQLNTEGYRTGRGEPWTDKRLVRMLQRSGIGGLHGLLHSKRAF